MYYCGLKRSRLQAPGPNFESPTAAQPKPASSNKYYYKKYLFNISAQPPDNVEAAAPVKNWGGCDLYFLIIEYKTEENISAV